MGRMGVLMGAPVYRWRLRIRTSESAGTACAYLRGILGDGRPVATSALASVVGCVVTTRSGSRYRLEGPPSVQFAPDLGAYDPADPLAGMPDRLGFGWYPVTGGGDA